MKIPSKFLSLLEKDQQLLGIVMKTVHDYEQILAEARLYFFEEYTDHGINHIENVLSSCQVLITENSFSLLTAKDIATLILAVLLHDIGMHTEFSTFKALVEEKRYDNVLQNVFDKKTWSELWEDYLDEAKKFSGKQRRLIFGNEFKSLKRPILIDKDDLTGTDKKLIGEFIRRHHPRLAHEIAFNGLISENNNIEFASDLPLLIRQLSGVLARSHGIEIRDTYNYLKEIGEKAWKRPDQIHIIFLMVVLRIADYLQIDANRVKPKSVKVKTFSSPVSKTEHDKHLSIDFIQPDTEDPETLYIKASPVDSIIFIKLKDLFTSIQYELDISWAVLGEIYGKEHVNLQPQILLRRINSNLYDQTSDFLNNAIYIPKKIHFQADEELPKLLISPLYGNNPTYGVRELVQNSVDACREREIDEGGSYIPNIQVSIIDEGGKKYFIIKDNGKGMTFFELSNYFLKAGASLRKSLEWQRKYTDDQGKSRVQRTGRFGVGVLAAFLLGNKIFVETRNKAEKYGYKFEAQIDTEQINVLKDDTLGIGTFIKIVLEDNSFEMIIKSEDKNDKPNYTSWREWYVLNSPKIVYSLLGKILETDINTIPDPYKSTSETWNSIDFPGLNKILWSYDPKYKKTPFSCNGIKVPDTPSIDRNFGVTKQIQIVKETPIISVFDNDGVFPLTLNRNQIDGKLIFSEDLLNDIYKDIIASLLNYNPQSYISKNKLCLTPAKFNHGAFSFWYNSHYENNGPLSNLLFHENGFSTNYGYFLNYLTRKEKISIYLKKSMNLDFTFKEEIGENYMFEVSIPNLRPSYARYWVDPSYFLFGGGIVSISDILYKEIIDNPKSKVTVGLIRNHKILNNNQWITYSYKYNKSQFLHTNNILFSDFAVSGIAQTTICKSSSLEAFDLLLKKYIGKEVIIPYNIEERKKKYSLAFSELESYMRKYKI